MTMMMMLMTDTVHGGEQDGRLLPIGDDGDDDYVDEDGDKEDSDGDDDDVLKKTIEKIGQCENFNFVNSRLPA